MMYMRVSVSDLILRPEDLEVLKGLIEAGHKDDTKWMGSGKPSAEYVRPAKFSDISVSLVDGNEVEVKRMWYVENVLDKA